jgi:hypothetical protein
VASAAVDEATHLVRRFFGHVTARPLRPVEQEAVRDALGAPLAALFFAQNPADQRHAFEVALGVRAALPDDHDAFVAALVHDVGKAGLEMGAVTRSVATVCDVARLPMPDRWRRYRNHGTYGADALEEAGAPALAVQFARWHPGPVPDGIDPQVWATLSVADHL